MTDTVYASDSVINTVKKSLDIAIDDTSFDTVLLLHINAVFSDLYQIGLGVYGSLEYEITDDTDLWTTVFGTQRNLGMIKSYVVLRVRLLFDPPAAGFTTTSMQNQIDKMEYRIRLATSSAPNAPDGMIEIPGVTVTQENLWNLTGLTDFPSDAPIGAVGIDFSTGKVWRKTA